MFGSVILETALALVLVFLLLSLLCSGVNEIILGHFRALRSKLLQSFLKRLLSCPDNAPDDPGQFANKVLNHPLILGLKPADRDRPAYIPPLTFVSAVLNELLSTPELAEHKAAEKKSEQLEDRRELGSGTTAALIGNLDVSDLQAAINRLQDDRVRKLFAGLLQDVETMPAARERIERWFNESMDRLTGAYKRKAQFWLHILSLIVVVGLNIDTIEIARQFMANSTQRTAFVAMAEETARTGMPGTPTNTVQLTALTRQIKDLNLPIGWGGCLTGTNNLAKTLSSDWTMSAPSCPSGFQGWLLKVAGLLLTAAAVSLGAPFWFDLLNRVTNLRAGGRPPKT